MSGEKKGAPSAPKEPPKARAAIAVELGDFDDDGRLDVSLVAEFSERGRAPKRILLFKENLDALEAVTVAIEALATVGPVAGPVVDGILGMVLGKRTKTIRMPAPSAGVGSNPFR